MTPDRTAPRRLVSRVLAVAVLTALLVPAGTAHALSLPVSIESLAASADAVVVARVMARTFRQMPAPSPGRFGAIYTDADLRVQRVLKGSRPVTMRVTTLGGTVGQLTLATDESAAFTPGERVILFLDKDGEIVSGRQGKLALDGDIVPSRGQSLEIVEMRIANGSRHAANDAWYGTVQNLLDTAPDTAADAVPFSGASLAATGPGIISIAPSGRPSGMGAPSAVTIAGSGFGATTGQVTFAYGGYINGTYTERVSASITSWTDTSIVCQIPVASSGSVTVSTSASASYSFPYAVGFGYEGRKWKSGSMTYRVNPNSPSGSVDELTLVQTAAQAWGGWSGFSFAYGGVCATTTTKDGLNLPTSDGNNDIYWYSGYPLGSGILAENTYWISGSQIVESDIAYNSNWVWGDGSSGTYDIATVGVHELGHSIGLNDQYGSADRGKIMFGAAAAGTRQRTPRADDLAGLRALFGGTSALGGSATFNGGTAYTRFQTVAVSASVANASAMRFFNGSSLGSWLTYGADSAITLSSSANGAYIVRAQYAQNADGSGDAIGSSSTLVLDTIAPTGSLSLSGGAANVSTTTVEADSAVTDVNPVETRFSVDGQTTWTPWEAYAAARSLVLPAGDGLKSVYAEYRDGAGNTLSVSDTITLDTYVPPPAAPTGLTAGASTPAPAIALAWTDNATNETGYVVERSENGGAFAQFATPAAGSTSYKDTLGSLSAARQWGSTWAYRVKAVNSGGSSSYNTSTGLRLDTTAPATSAAVSATYVGSASITIVPSDGQSGVWWTDHQIDSSTPASGTVATTSLLGAHTIRHRAVDIAGNLGAWSTPAQSFTVVAPTYTLTYTAGANGTISGTTPQTVNYNGSGTAVTAVPNTGYHFTGWSDGVGTAARTDSNVTANKSVTAGFAIDTPGAHTLTYWAGAGGTISGATPQTVASGGSGTQVTAVAGTGYTFVKWSDNVMTAARTDSNVTADKSVTASFAINTYTLTYTAGAGGTISGTSPQTVNYSGSGTAVTAVPNTGYHFVSWSDGALTAARADTSVTANKSVTANFAADTPSLTPVYRFYNLKSGVHFYTASEAEMATVRDTLYRTYRFEGVAYSINTANLANSIPLYRFYNIKKGVHFYTASEAEKDAVLRTLASTYRLEGVAYNVSLSPSGGATPVYRFYNLKQGVHFYTASEAEKDAVLRTLASTYRLEGVGYSLAP